MAAFMPKGGGGWQWMLLPGWRGGAGGGHTSTGRGQGTAHCNQMQSQCVLAHGVMCLLLVFVSHCPVQPSCRDAVNACACLTAACPGRYAFISYCLASSVSNQLFQTNRLLARLPTQPTSCNSGALGQVALSMYVQVVWGCTAVASTSLPQHHK